MKTRWKYGFALAVTFLTLCMAAPVMAEYVEPEDGRGVVRDIKPGETAYLARNRKVTLTLSMDARQATAQAQKSGQMYHVTQVNKPTFNTGNQRERLTCLSVAPQGFLRVKTERTD